MPLYEHTTGSERVFIPLDMVNTNHAEYLRLKNSPDWKQIGEGSTPDPVEEPEPVKEPEPQPEPEPEPEEAPLAVEAEEPADQVASPEPEPFKPEEPKKKR